MSIFVLLGHSEFTFIFWGYSLVSYVLASIGLMKIFPDIGFSSYQAWIPVYRVYLLFKTVWTKRMFFVYFVLHILQRYFPAAALLFFLIDFFAAFVTMENPTVKTPLSGLTGDQIYALGTGLVLLSFLFCIFCFLVWWKFCLKFIKAFCAPVSLAVIMLFLPCVDYLLVGFGKRRWADSQERTDES